MIPRFLGADSLGRLASLWGLPVKLALNRFRTRKNKVGRIILIVLVAGFVSGLFLSTRELTAEKIVTESDAKIGGSIQLGAILVSLMLVFGNFATALQGFYGAFDIPYLLALPLRKSDLLFGRAASTIWNASWTAMIFCLPMALGFLIGVDAHPAAIVLSLLSIAALTILCGLIGILLATLFVNLIPTSRMLELFVVILTVFILFLALLSPEIGAVLPEHSAKMKNFSELLESHPVPLLDYVPQGLFASVFISAKNHVLAISAFLLLIGWLVTGMLVTAVVFSALFLRGWNLTFAGRPRQRIIERRSVGRGRRLIDQQLAAIITKEIKMFIRDPAQAVQFLVILLMTFFYLFNLKSLRALTFAAEEGTNWWQATLGLANVSMGGCVAAAMATRFVFPSVSLEGRAFPILMVTPMDIPRLLYAKCVAWFWPTSLVTSVLLVSGGMSLQLPPLALLYTFIVSLALSLGLVGLGVGMGAVHARFDWDQSSSINSSWGALLYMLFSFVLIIATLLPAGFLFLTACVPSFSNQMSPMMRVGPVFVSLSVLVLLNYLVARGALKSGGERLKEAG